MLWHPRVASLAQSLAATNGLRTTLGWWLGGCIAVVGLWQTGMIAALPGAIGLTALAVSDAATRRFSVRTFRVAGALVVVGLLLDTARASAWDRLAVGIALVSAVTLTWLVLWLATVGVAFGDVLLATFAVLIPAWLSPRAVGSTIFVALVVGGAVAAIQRHHRRSSADAGTIALGPALLMGWVAGVVIG